jgi:sporulation protein YlmC with PRC-barrel domain
MLNKARTLKGYKLDSFDGEIGTVKEFYFDDHHWTIRYLVADTGNWLLGRQVLISPYALVTVNKEEQYITVDLTKKQIEDSPSLNSDKPVSRQFENDYYGYFGWPLYWGGPYMWGAYPYIVHDRDKWKDHTQGGKAWDPNLRSTSAVNGYHIQTIDGEIGHVEDFIVDDETWAIRYLIVDTRNWWPGKKVLISPKWIERVSWSESKVFVNLTRETIKQSPEYTEESLITRDYETGLHRHYDRQGYWVDEPAAKEHSRTAPQDGCLLASRQLSVGWSDLSLRQSVAEGAAETVAREASGGRTLGHDAGPELYLRAFEPDHQEV